MRNFAKAAIVIVALLALCIMTTGCAQPKVNTVDQSAQQQRRLRFIFIAPCLHEDFFKPVKKGMRDAAALMGIESTFTGTEVVDLKAQAALVSKAVADGYDGIAISIIDPVAFDSVIAEAMARGVAVVSFNVDDNNTANARLSAVCQNLYQAGRKMGAEAAKFIADGSSILMTVHSAGISALEDRLRGAQDVLKDKAVNWKVVVAGTQREQAMEVIAAELEANPDVRVVLCTGLVDTEAAGMVIEKFYKGKGYACAGFDLSSDILRLVKAGTIEFTIDQQPYIQGFYPVIQLALYCRYGITPSNIDAGAAIITKENYDSVIELSKKNYR